MPQGYKAAGDAYTERFDKIVADVKNKVKCIDDTLVWATFEYLELCSRNGIVFNPKKFVFCKKEVEYAGFVIGEKSVKPNDKMISSILNFPVPKNMSDIQAWFGLINQVSPYSQRDPTCSHSESY